MEGSYALQLTILCYLSAVCDIGSKSFDDYSKSLITKGRTIRKLMGGAGEVQKKNSRKGKLNEKKFLHVNKP